jgi:hypothetical protein
MPAGSARVTSSSTGPDFRDFDRRMSLRQRHPRLAKAFGQFAAVLAYGLLAAGVWFAMAGLGGERPGTVGSVAYWVSATFLLGWALTWIARRNVEAGKHSGGEMLRLMLLVAAAGWVLKSLLTMHFVGGLDARWYGYTMIDALEQARSGHWPVFVGQGAFQWNGAVHPIRTAPMFLNLGILLDLLTLRRLTPLGVEHLTLAVAVVQAALLCYILLVRCAPWARWTAWIAALSWLLAPMVLAYLVAQEMYMTVMALSWLPLVYYGNVRLVQRDDGIGQICLAAGLTLTWMSHAAVAAWATVITIIIQGLRLLLRDFTWPAWRRALLGALLFAWLGAYYFCSMAELSPAKAAVSAGAIVGLLALLAAVAAVLRLGAGGTRRWWWLAFFCLAALWLSNRMYFNWLAALLIWTALLRLWRRWRGDGVIAAGLPEFMVMGVLGAAAAAIQFPFRALPQDLARDGQAADFLMALAPALFQPISPHAVQLTDLQLGYVLWGSAAIGFLLAWWRGKWEARLLALAGLCVFPLIAHVPQLTASLMLAVPDWLYGISSVSLWMRLLPSFSLLAVFALFLGLSRWAPRGILLRCAGGAALVAVGAKIVFWDVTELQKLRFRALLSVNLTEGTAAFYRQDSAQLYSYSYDSLPWPEYMLNGTLDYHLESRLLRASDLRLLPEPLLDAPTGRDVTLATNSDSRGSNWLRLAPSLHLDPGEGMILKFEFFAKAYDGTLILMGPQGFYRNYYLPAAGFYPNSFGVAPRSPKTLAVWDSIGVPQEIHLTFLAAAVPKSDFGDFARVRLQPYRPADLQIQTLGLVPYRARVKATEPVFLETPRVYIPGYRARVDGRRAGVAVSPEHLAMVRLEPGVHEVSVYYRPTLKLLLALGLSALGWAGTGIWIASRLRQPASGARRGG